MRRAAIATLTLLACSRGASAPSPSPAPPPVDASLAEPIERSAIVDASAASVLADAEPTPTWEPDGNDDEEDPGTGSLPREARWERVGTPPLALTRICDLTPFGGSLYAAHANQPLGTDGATITRYDPDDTTRPFRVAFDWNRPGEPTKGGGAGQGFVRVHAIGGRLFVPDADPPYGGLGLVDWGTEGYVFVSDDRGVFAPPRAPHFRPPGPPELRASATPRAGAGVLPRAYHVLDVIRYRGGIYASTGSVPPRERAWNGPSPGALHRASEDGSRWTYAIDYPHPWKDGVWRLTYLVRFRGRLYAGIQDFEGKDPNDFVVFEGDELRHETARAVRITRKGASGTLRWWVDTHVKPARLYWLAWTRDGIALRVTTDGDHWAVIDLSNAGAPTDVTRFRDAVVVLTTTGLYRLDGAAIEGAGSIAEGVAETSTTLVAKVEGTSKSPFEVTDFFCTAPLAVLRNRLYAGGQRGGSLYRLAE